MILESYKTKKSPLTETGILLLAVVITIGVIGILFTMFSF
jgi:hypothetical protein